MCKGNDFSPNEQRFFPKCEAQASEKALFNISPTLSPLNPPCAAPQNRKRSLSLPPEFPLASPGVPSSFPLPLPFPFPQLLHISPSSSRFLFRDFIAGAPFLPLPSLIPTSNHPNAIFRRNLRPYRRSLRLYRCSLRLYGRSMRLNFPPVLKERSPFLPQNFHLRSGPNFLQLRFFKGDNSMHSLESQYKHLSSVTGALFFKLKNVFFCLLPAVPSIPANVREMSEK